MEACHVWIGFHIYPLIIYHCLSLINEAYQPQLGHGDQNIYSIIYVFVVNSPNFLLCRASQLSETIKKHISFNDRQVQISSSFFLQGMCCTNRTKEDAVFFWNRRSVKQLHPLHVTKESHRIHEIMSEFWTWLFNFVNGLNSNQCDTSGTETLNYTHTFYRTK